MVRSAASRVEMIGPLRKASTLSQMAGGKDTADRGRDGASFTNSVGKEQNLTLIVDRPRPKSEKLWPSNKVPATGATLPVTFSRT